ncbi:hypothetical protein ACPT9S_29815, partial [Klebsiella pneumoniae]
LRDVTIIDDGKLRKAITAASRRVIGFTFFLFSIAFLAELAHFRKRQKNQRDGRKRGAGIAGCNLCNKRSGFAYTLRLRNVQSNQLTP